MKKTFIALTALLLGACSLTGQKNLYAVKLLNGEMLYSEKQPQKKEAHYQFKDVNGQQYIIGEKQVLSIQKEVFKK